MIRAVVYTNTNRRDSILKRGTVITAINGVPMITHAGQPFSLHGDGWYSMVHKYQTLSNLGTFGGLYQAVFGQVDTFNVHYIDAMARQKYHVLTYMISGRIRRSADT